MRISISRNYSISNDEFDDARPEKVGLELVDVTKDSIESEGIGDDDRFPAKRFWKDKDRGVEYLRVVLDYFTWSRDFDRGGIGRVSRDIGESTGFNNSLTEDVRCSFRAWEMAVGRGEKVRFQGEFVGYPQHEKGECRGDGSMRNHR